MKINRTFGKITGHLGIVFENEQSKINFISSEISWDQILDLVKTDNTERSTKH